MEPSCGCSVMRESNRKSPSLVSGNRVPSDGPAMLFHGVALDFKLYFKCICVGENVYVISVCGVCV